MKVGTRGRTRGAGKRCSLRSHFLPMPKITGYRDLEVWQRGMRIVPTVYGLSRSFPGSALYGLTSPLRRAAVSILSETAEAKAGATTREYLKHVWVAQASLAEAETHGEIAVRLGYLTAADVSELWRETAPLGRQLYALRDALRKETMSRELNHALPNLISCERSEPPTPGPQIRAPGPIFQLTAEPPIETIP